MLDPLLNREMLILVVQTGWLKLRKSEFERRDPWQDSSEARPVMLLTSYGGAGSDDCKRSHKVRN